MTQGNKKLQISMAFSSRNFLYHFYRVTTFQCKLNLLIIKEWQRLHVVQNTQLHWQVWTYCVCVSVKVLSRLQSFSPVFLAQFKKDNPPKTGKRAFLPNQEHFFQVKGTWMVAFMLKHGWELWTSCRQGIAVH